MRCPLDYGGRRCKIRENWGVKRRAVLTGEASGEIIDECCKSIVQVERYPPRRQDTDTVQDTGSADEEVWDVFVRQEGGFQIEY